MSGVRARRLQFAAACGLVAGYAALSHYCNANGAHRLGAALTLAPMTCLSLVLAWRGARPLVAVLVAMVIGAVIVLVWPLLEKNFPLWQMTQESVAYTLLGLTFGRSLDHRRTALCTELADRVHGPLSPEVVRYTRRVTLAWAVFFFSIAAVSVLLFWAAPLRVWSIFINFCVVPLVGVMFVGEYLVRRRALPQLKNAGLLATVRVYFASP